MTTYLPGQLPAGDPNMAGRREFSAQREAREAELAEQWAALREQSRPQREAEQRALAEAREAAQNRAPSNQEIINGDIREAVTGTRPRPGAADSIRAKSRELIAITRHRSAPVTNIGG